MNCEKCGHTYLIHKFIDSIQRDGISLFNGGQCMIDGCECRYYVDKIELIDEDLM
jgi:hypothetical protein